MYSSPRISQANPVRLVPGFFQPEKLIVHRSACDNFMTIICILLSIIFLMATRTARGVLVVGLNPALQRTLELGGLHIGEVNRAQQATIGIGGKGQNCVTAISLLMSKTMDEKITLAQFVGSGVEGDLLLELLREKPFDESLTTRLAGPCRTAITLADTSSGEATEVVEPSSPCSPDDVVSLLAAVRQTYSQTKVKAVSFMGSMPPGCMQELYSEILSLCADENTKVCEN